MTAKGKQAAASVTARRLFAYLDGHFDADAQAAVEAEAARDPAVAAELAACRSLFEALDGLGRLAPPTEFAVRTLARLRVRHSLWDRLRGWVAGTGPPVFLNVFAAFLDGELSRSQARTLRRFVDSDPEAAAALEGWARIYRRLGRLPQLRPASGFGARIMAATPIPTARKRRLGLVEKWARKRWPGRRERLAAGFGVAFGVVFWPAAFVAVIAHGVFSNPQITLGGLAGFVGAKVLAWGAALPGVFGAAVTGVAQESFGLWQGTASFAPAVMTALAAGGVIVLLSVWILCKNALNSSGMEGQHAPV